jgi:hypothetical protein
MGYLLAAGEIQAGELGLVEQGLLAELEETLITPAVHGVRLARVSSIAATPF